MKRVTHREWQTYKYDRRTWLNRYWRNTFRGRGELHARDENIGCSTGGWWYSEFGGKHNALNWRASQSMEMADVQSRLNSEEMGIQSTCIQFYEISILFSVHQVPYSIDNAGTF